jgi:hypothetical protein
MAVLTVGTQGGGIFLHNRNVAVSLPDVRHYPLALFAEGDVLVLGKRNPQLVIFCNG